MSSLKYSVVDAFTTTPLKGNSAAVIVLNPTSPALSDKTLQHIAAEFNLSETAFVIPQDASRGKFGLRWFTPTVEVPLCGHATLASASILFSLPEHLPRDVKKIEFSTLSGILTANKLTDGRIEIELPAGEATAVDEKVQSRVVDVVRRAFPANSQPNVRYVGAGHGTFGFYLLIDVDGVDIENLAIQTGVFVDLAPLHRLLVFTQKGRSPKESFTSRVFAPDLGVSEDPVCGSAHCMLGPYWAKKLELDSAVELNGRQVSQRTGDVGVVWEREKGTCRLRGYATLSARGEMYLPQ